MGHSTDTWAERKRDLTEESSSRWAGSITKATHDQWALSRRAQLAHIQGLKAGIATIAHRLSLPVGEKGTKGSAGGYHTRQEWFTKSRRLRVLEDRLSKEQADWEAGRVRVVRGGKRLARNRHNLQAAQLTEEQWQKRWKAKRWFLAADGESGKKYGNETIRVTPGGEVSPRWRVWPTKRPDRCGHQRRSPGRVAPGRARQPLRRASAVLLRPFRRRPAP
ncbi:hypothetical protein [Actinoallomurus iriomotensis]|uniref:Transposase n=1 Tax=Actinoallomurus iriomotensis TaxID=478107 RepID=A0A9W6S6W3_9ACTN|nr:hypothetical protein [Actinoallomurus iriomotensis]GLY88489.1 hypothetical protein Airi02_064180 [Actinoallomurus iriomotensis]